jgi:hypothetical protein
MEGSDLSEFLRYYCETSRKGLNRMRQALLDLDQQAHFDNWTPGVADYYHQLHDEITALEYHLYALEVTYAPHPPEDEPDDTPSLAQACVPEASS